MRQQRNLFFFSTAWPWFWAECLPMSFVCPQCELLSSPHSNWRQYIQTHTYIRVYCSTLFAFCVVCAVLCIFINLLNVHFVWESCRPTVTWASCHKWKKKRMTQKSLNALMQLCSYATKELPSPACNSWNCYQWLPVVFSCQVSSRTFHTLNTHT